MKPKIGIADDMRRGVVELLSTLLADETDYVLYLSNESELKGLPDDVRAGAAAAAEERGHKGQWAILNTRSSMDPFLTYSTRRDLREKVWRTYYSRGDNGDAKDNNGLIRKILKLRAERAKLLGYPTHAHWRLENAMAKTPENAMDLMMRVWPAAVKRAIARSPIEVVMPGGSLTVQVSASFDVALSGAVEQVCRGQLSDSWVRGLGAARRRLRSRKARD